MLYRDIAGMGPGNEEDVSMMISKRSRRCGSALMAGLLLGSMLFPSALVLASEPVDRVVPPDGRVLREAWLPPVAEVPAGLTDAGAAGVFSGWVSGYERALEAMAGRQARGQAGGGGIFFKKKSQIVIGDEARPWVGFISSCLRWSGG